MKGARTTAGILSFVVAGFFFYSLAMLAFISTPEWWIKVVIAGSSAVPAAIFFGLGAWCWGRNVLQTLGIVFLSAAGMTGMAVLSFFAILMTPEYAVTLPPETRQLFSSVWTGAACLGGYVAVGLALLLAGRRTSPGS